MVRGILAFVGVACGLGVLAQSSSAAVIVGNSANLMIYGDVPAGGSKDGGTDTSTLGTYNTDNANVGGPGNSGNPDGYYNVLVVPFQLPNVGAVASPFTSASFTAYDQGGENIFQAANVDLYGLGARTSSTVALSDYYVGASDPTDATKLQAAFRPKTGATAPANGTAYSTSAAANAQLVAYLNAQYAGGANAGNYVFLRLNTDQTDVFNKYDNFYSANGANATVDLGAGPVDLRPSITYTVATSDVPEPATLTVVGIASMILASRRGKCVAGR